MTLEHTKHQPALNILMGLVASVIDETIVGVVRDSDCDQCQYITDDDNAHCYMFEHKVDNCGQFKQPRRLPTSRTS